MSNICLSPTPNLRCQSLSSTESVVLLIPSGLELIFGVGLLVCKRGSRDKLHCLLSAEGLIYFALALADLIAHLVPAVANSLQTFKAFDITIGVLSTLPLLSFTVYLFLFASRDLAPTLPRRMQSVSKYTILLLIPVILLFNELASFVSLTYRVFEGIIAVKFTNGSSNIFLNSLALVVLSTFQGICFCMCLYRLVMALINQKRIDMANTGQQEAHLFNGIGWTAMGIKLGFVESLVGFAPGQFGLSLTRRILRFVGRACLIIGVLKGLDTVEDFSMLEVRERLRRSQILPTISTPINTTFRQIGGYQYESSMDPPQAVARSRPISVETAEQGEEKEVPLDRSRSPDVEWLPPWKMAHANEEKASTPALTVDTQNLTPSGGQRVHVRYRRGRAPTLEMKRLSNFLQSIPSPLTAESSGHGSLSSSPLTPPESPEVNKSAMIPTSLYAEEDAPRSYSMAFMDSPLVGVPLPDRNRIRPKARRTLASSTELSIRSDSPTFPRQSTMSLGGPLRGGDSRKHLEDLHALAMTSASTVAHSFRESYEATIGSATVSRSSSSRTMNSNTGLIQREGSVKRKAVPAYFNEPKSAKVEKEAVTTGEFEPIKDEEEELVPPMPNLSSLQISALSSRTRDRAQGKLGGPVATRRYTSPESKGMRSPQAASVKSTASSRVDFTWSPDSVDIAAEGHAELDAAWEKMGVQRIKSIGSAPRRWTPAPSESTFSRGSMAAEWDDDEDIMDIGSV